MMVETTTHARAWIAILAMQAGMDVYIEKPMCLTIAEGRTMVNAARKYNARHPGRHAAAVDADQQLGQRPGQERRLGKILTVLAPNFVGPDRWTKTSTADAQGEWIDGGTSGPTRPSCGRMEPELHFGWARWWDYDGGGLCFGVTGWGTHSYDQINRALGTDDTGPVESCLKSRSPIARPAAFGRAVGRRAVLGDTGDSGHRHRLPRHGQADGPAGQGAHEVRQRHGAAAAPRRRSRPGPGRDLRRREGQDRDQPQQVASNPKEIVRAPDNPGRNRRPKRPTTSRTGSSASRAASNATPTSRSASDPRRSATW